MRPKKCDVLFEWPLSWIFETKFPSQISHSTVTPSILLPFSPHSLSKVNGLLLLQSFFCFIIVYNSKNVVTHFQHIANDFFANTI